MTNKNDITFQDQLWLEISKEIKDKEKSPLFAQILAGLILLSTKISNASKSNTKLREVTA